MIDYEILKAIWWLFIGVLLSALPSWTGRTWALARYCLSWARMTANAVS